MDLIGRAVTGYAGACRRRVTLDQQGPTIVHQKPGPLQTIFDLLPDEVSTNFIIVVISNESSKFVCLGWDFRYMFSSQYPDYACAIFLRLLSTVIHVPWRGHSCIMAECMFPRGTYVFTPMFSLSK